MRGYIDFKLIEEYPNKYNLTPKSIKKLKILDWDRLKKQKKTWQLLCGNWWCHLEGSNLTGRYDDEDEFWIGFNESNNEIDYNFCSHGEMCGYNFKEFYNVHDIKDKYDMHVQVNAIRWLNEMIDDGILGI